LTAQGHPRAIFKRAIERDNVTMAEATAREFALTLDEALQLVLLHEAQGALTALADLRGNDCEQAARVLTDLAREHGQVDWDVEACEWFVPEEK
jgi:hypothetical protein